MKNWKYKRLSECSNFISERTSNITIDNYISTENMIENRGGVKIASTLPDVKSTSAYKPNDILLSNIRPYFCKIWFADKKGSCSNDVLVVRAKKEIDPKFLYYVLSDQNFFNWDSITSKGTKMPRGTPNAIMKYSVPDIPLRTQQKIASILSAYDNLIQNYKKQIEALQTAASELYKEWFVRFRFPGYKNSRFENGIPEGWKIERIGNIGEVIGGGTPSTENEEYWDGDIPWLSPVDLSDNTNVYVSRGGKNITKLGLQKSSAKMMPKDTVLLSSRAPVGYVALAKNPICTNQGFKSVVCNTSVIQPIYLYFYFRMNKNYLQSIASGATFPELSGSMMKKLKVLLPQMELQKEFSKKANIFISKAELLSEQITNLTQQRDLLLPRLMRGALEVH
ncbi:restriction endonuclease subunit S [Treponema succinifaciens]|uniref:restriction endonuclease subunit S n=1 Tax=Treponema succinifaciens TaxID=167 RepID=UPI003FF03843